MSPDQKARSTECIKKLEEWLNNPLTVNPYKIEENNGYQRKYYYCYIEKYFPLLVTESCKEEKNNSINCYKLNAEEKAKFLEEKKKKITDNFNYYKGFTNIFEEISKSKIPIVGHNCFFDALFWMSHFHDQLDPSYVNFKRKFNKYFPK